MLKVWWIGLLCAALTGCSRGEAQAQGSSDAVYQRPARWSSECYGRFVVDVPGRLEFGSAEKNFGRDGEHRTAGYKLVDQARRFGGSVSLASLGLRETHTLNGAGDFLYVWKQADSTYRIDLVRDGGPTEERELRQRATQKLSLPNNAFIWRHKNQFDFGALVESDMRARMLHGELSGNGSIAQAKAVVDALWPRYRPRKPGETPSDPGICTPYGFLADPPKATERDYSMTFNFPDPRHSNLVLRLSVTTHSEGTLDEGEKLAWVKPEDMPTPWEEEERHARKEKEKCRPQQGTASRNLFGCMFAGLTNIKAHREVEYLTLSSGQRARLLVMEYRHIDANDPQYEVSLEAPGEPNSATRPTLYISATGMPKSSTYAGMNGKQPPDIDEAVKTVRTLAASLRPRPGAVAEGAVVKDTLEDVR